MPPKWEADALSAPPSMSEDSLVGPDKLKQLYRMMLKLRIINERVDESSTANKQRFRLEACEVGCTVDLGSQDLIAMLPNQQPVAYLTRGIKPSEFLRHKTQRRLVLRLSRPQELALSSNILDAQHSRLSLATGASFAYKAAHSGNVVIAFCLAEEIVRAQDSIYFAMQHGLPIIYVQLSKRRAQSRGARQQLSYPSLAAIPVDQNDVVAIYRVASESIEKARRGVGPTLIQCLPFDLPSTKNRPVNQSSDPIVYMEQHLNKKNLWSADLKNTIRENFLREINEALEDPHRVP